MIIIVLNNSETEFIHKSETGGTLKHLVMWNI